MSAPTDQARDPSSWLNAGYQLAIHWDDAVEHTERRAAAQELKALGRGGREKALIGWLMRIRPEFPARVPATSRAELARGFLMRLEDDGQ